MLVITCTSLRSGPIIIGIYIYMGQSVTKSERFLVIFRRNGYHICFINKRKAGWLVGMQKWTTGRINHFCCLLSTCIYLCCQKVQDTAEY